MKQIFALFALLPLLLPAQPTASPSFSVDATLPAADGSEVRVAFRIAPKHYLYAERVKITAVDEAVKLVPKAVPEAKKKPDPFTGQDVAVYDHDTTFLFTVTPPTEAFTLRVAYQGCNDSLCFLPERVKIPLGVPADAPPPSVPDAGLPPPLKAIGTQELFEHFTVAGRAAGYVKSDQFLAFLDRAEKGEGIEQDGLAKAFKERGVLVSLLLVLLGGLALNLTPCVLPMIPVNLAIIGAGTKASSKTRGFALGTTYGAGIALVYGLLGLLVVLTGAKFGTLNSKPWFNIGVAIVFVVLALAMLDVFLIDLSRLQTRFGGGGEKGGFVAALFLGALAALLAGACVAPVVISVLLMAASLSSAGNQAGLLLPFLLGIGMALPWPLAGAGLSFLPKPGRWMEQVKRAFAVLILAMAAWYGWQGITLYQGQSEKSRQAVVAAQADREEEGWFTGLEDALRVARDDAKPVFIDFWASWCKNCLKMEKTTFKDPAVEKRLAGYVRVKFQAEDIGSPETKAVLDRFGAIGLPTYVILQPR